MTEKLLKTVVIMAMGVFLFTRLTSNTLLFYINDRFVSLIVLASAGFLVVAAGYWLRPGVSAGSGRTQVSWAGLLLVSLPVLLGVLVAPRPLGAAALSNREVSLSSLTTVTVPESTSTVAPAERNAMDWLIAFRRAADPAEFVGQDVDVVGFVYRDDRFGSDTFLAGRFIVSCCVADANPIGLIVRTADASTYADDEWLRVTGVLELGEFDGESMAIVAAATIERVDPPSQPYLYP